MKYVVLIITAAIIFNFGVLNNVKAQTTPQFFETLYDVPLMSGMREVEDAALAFDKPEGRIAKAAGVVSDTNKTAIEAYYNTSLSQMGWQKTAPLVFKRKAEHLKIYIEKSEGYGDNAFLVSFHIEPIAIPAQK